MDELRGSALVSKVRTKRPLADQVAGCSGWVVLQSIELALSSTIPVGRVSAEHGGWGLGSPPAAR